MTHVFLSNAKYQSRLVGFIFGAIAIMVSLMLWLRGPNVFAPYTYTFYNNYIIFRNAFLHLISGQNMYVLYPDQQWDLYKYSPTFAVWMAPFAFLPDIVGLIIWNLINVFALYWGLHTVNFKHSHALVWATLFLFQEVYVATINSQSNTLIAGLLLSAFGLWERGKARSALVCISTALFIKPFVLVFFLLWFFYDKKWHNLVFAFLYCLVLAILPALIVGFNGLWVLYNQWFTLLSKDHDASFGISVMGVLQVFFALEHLKDVVIILSSIALLVPLIRTKLYQKLDFKIHYAAFLLIWMVIFNHKAESPTYIIATVGVALWFFVQNRNALEWVFVFAVFIFTQFSTSDLFPEFIRNQYFRPYHVKAIPCIVLWLYLGFRLLTHHFNTEGKTLKQP